MGREIIEGIRAIKKGQGKRYTVSVPPKVPSVAKETPARYSTQMSTKISTKIGAQKRAPKTPGTREARAAKAIASLPPAGAPAADPSADPRNRTIPAGEIKRRGIGAVDRLLEYGPVHVISGNQPRYVVMEESYYQELREEVDEASAERIRQSDADYKAGKGRIMTPEEILAEALAEDDGA